jgi:hypothetical protein
MTKKLTILLVHFIVAIFLGYLSYIIVNKKQIPDFVGILLGISAVAVVIVHIYFYVTKNTTISNYRSGDSQERRLRDKREDRRHLSPEKEASMRGLHGFHVNPHAGRFKPIGGVPKGVTWI